MKYFWQRILLQTAFTWVNLVLYFLIVAPVSVLLPFFFKENGYFLTSCTTECLEQNKMSLHLVIFSWRICEACQMTRVLFIFCIILYPYNAGTVKQLYIFKEIIEQWPKLSWEVKLHNLFFFWWFPQCRTMMQFYVVLKGTLSSRKNKTL